MSLDRPARPEPWHRMPVENVLAALGTSARGLVASEARRRLAAHGPNLLPGGSRRTALDLVAGQFSDVMILVLLAAAVVAGVIGELLDAAAILAILLLNAVVGVVQEYRAERALQALRTLAAPTAVALRDGHPTVMPAAELVPGDVVRLEAGALIPADLRLLEAPRLRVDESPLTGESVPAEKLIAALDAEDLALADRVNMAYKGTLVTYGRGQGAVVATGTATELGRIASLLEQAERVQTPLQRRLAQLGRRLAAAALFVCGAVFAVGVARGEPLLLMFLTAVSLAVAAIPEALPAVVTIALALGARKMVAQRALVRRLSAVETLGSVTYVCADKTGTLTLNRMRVEEVWRARAATEPGPVAPEEGPDLLRLAMALCNDAEVTTAGGVQGDPTEAALAAAALEDGADKRALEAAWPRLAEVPFDAERKRMTTVHQEPGGRQVSFTKGAVETVLPRCAGGPPPPPKRSRKRSGWRGADCACWPWPPGAGGTRGPQTRRSWSPASPCWDSSASWTRLGRRRSRPCAPARLPAWFR